MADKKHIDEIFKEKLRHYEYKPSGEVWEKIESTLHPGTSTTETPTTTSQGKYIAYSLAFLFLCSFFLVYNLTGDDNFTAHQYEPSSLELEFKTPEVETAFADPDFPVNNEEKIQIVVKPTEISVYPVNSEIAVQSNSSATNQGYQNIVTDEPVKTNDISISLAQESVNNGITESTIRQLKNIATTTKPIAINSTIPVNEDPALRSLALSPIVEKTSRYLDDYNNGNENVKQIYMKDIESYSPHINLKGMSLGVAASYNQTSMLENGNIFKGDKPIQPSLKFGASKGITMGYNFSNKFGVQVDYIYNSVQGQNYVLSEDNNLVQKTLALYYNQIPVTFKLKVPRISDFTQKPVVVNYIAGLQYGMLTEYHIPQEKLYSGYEDIFKKDEISILLGVDYDVYLSNRSYLTLGARSSISNDISTHQYPLDDYAKRNFVFGLRASYNYTFREY
ncbi:MAG: hypothetical protein ACKVPJ_00540 [Chitinophagales bacterium]